MYKWSTVNPHVEVEFNTIAELINYHLERGIDPSYELTRDGVPAGEDLADHIVY
mgnify:CR=1 FL=1|tara:strand:+ start:372 stop:533 length:162 start_codon:yes stop_codon:yes gene_type:complete